MERCQLPSWFEPTFPIWVEPGTDPGSECIPIKRPCFRHSPSVPTSRAGFIAKSFNAVFRMVDVADQIRRESQASAEDMTDEELEVEVLGVFKELVREGKLNVRLMKRSTKWGSNWAPEQRRSSLNASRGFRPLR